MLVKLTNRVREGMDINHIIRMTCKHSHVQQVNSVRLSVRPSIHPSVRPSIPMSVRPSIYPPDILMNLVVLFLGPPKHLSNWLCPLDCLLICLHLFDDPQGAPYWPNRPCIYFHDPTILAGKVLAVKGGV